MVCAPVRSISPSLKLWDYLSVQAHKPCSIWATSTSMVKQDSLVEQINNYNLFLNLSINPSVFGYGSIPLKLAL